MNEILAVALRFAVDVGFKATILFSLTAAAVIALRRSGAAARHFVGSAGLVGALALPLLTFALPRFEVPLLKSPIPEETKISAWRRPAAVSLPRPEKETLPAPGSTRAAESLPAPASVEKGSPPPGGVPWLPIALGSWALGSLVVAARLAVGLHRVRRMRDEASLVRDSDWTQEAEDLARSLAVRRSVELYESSRVPVALTFGLFRPFLLLCRQARQWAVERRRVVLLHELAHVKRADWIWIVLSEAALALYWWHPLAWVLSTGVRRDGEKACDDLVLAAGTKPSVYAGHLLGIFRAFHGAVHPVAPAVASARPSHFEGRLRSILDPASPRRELPRMRAALSAAGLLGAAALLSAVTPWIPACSEAAILARGGELAAASESRADAAAASKCPDAMKKAVKAKAGAVRTSTEALSESPSVEPNDADPEEKSLEAGRTVPAVLKTLEKIREATSGFVRASKRSPNADKHEGAEWYSEAMDLHNDGRYDEAIRAFEKAIEAGYREDASSYNIACGYARLGKRDQAFEWLRKAADAGFDLQRYLGHDDDLDGLKPDPRWRELKNAIQQRPSARAEREAAAAAARYERIVAKNPKDGESFYQVGKELLNAGRFDLSAKAFAESAARGYRAGASLYNEACALSRGNQTRAALDMLQKALDAGFDQPALFDKDDDLDNVRGDPRFAQIAKEARDLSLPGYGTDNWFKGLSGQRARWREAAHRFEQYARANPQKARAWFNLGFASLAGDRPEAAVEGFKKALDLNYRKPTTMYNLACSYARLDQKDQAFDWLFKALDAGFDATGTLRGDEDLDNLRGDPRYRKALEIARARDKHDDSDED
jgi:beta-lactamase regulating signal transducer with metallopeptidase domain/tetratricopeptide (TPR) repeat protein